MYVTSVLLHKYTFVLMIKALSTHIQIFLKTESFFCVQKNTRPHAVYPIRFLPSTRKRDSVPYKSCAVWCMQKPPFPPSTPKPVIRYFFKKLLSKDRFRKPEFLASENAVVDLWTGPNLHFCLVLNNFFLGYKISLWETAMWMTWAQRWLAELWLLTSHLQRWICVTTKSRVKELDL